MNAANGYRLIPIATRRVAKMLLLTLCLESGGYAADPIRIMPLGDSITAGYTDNPNWTVDFEFGYRSGLYQRLTEAGQEVLFVGGSTEPFDNTFPGDPTRGGTYTPRLDLRAIGQDGHRGYGGQAAGFLLNGIRDSPAGQGWLAVDAPDIVLLHVGTNGQFTDLLTDLVDEMIASNPDLHVIVAQIIPKRDFNQSIVDYNAFIAQRLVSRYEAQGANVSFVDQYTDFLTDPGDVTSINASLYATGNHPNAQGYDIMAENWFQAIRAATIPEPTTASLLLLGLFLPGMTRNRRRQAS